MKVLPEEMQYDMKIAIKPHCLLEIDMSGRHEVMIQDDFWKKTKGTKDNKLTKILQTFNENIVSVDSEAQQYKVRLKNGEIRRLSFNRLSTAEKLFIICYMANELEKNVIVCRELQELDMPHFKLFFQFWANSPYIDIIIPTNLVEVIIKTLYNSCNQQGGGIN